MTIWIRQGSCFDDSRCISKPKKWPKNNRSKFYFLLKRLRIYGFCASATFPIVKHPTSKFVNKFNIFQQEERRAGVQLENRILGFQKRGGEGRKLVKPQKRR